jgi:multimeric flavodoxin WrbA
VTMEKRDFSDVSALYINTTLTRSPGQSHTQLLIDVSASIMAKQGVTVHKLRSIDHPIATGVHPDMREHGWDEDAWPELFERVMAADILVIGGPIWLGDNSSETKKIIERLYAHSGDLNSKGQWLYYGKVGGCLITGNEDGIKHCASNVLYSLQHIGYSIAPQSDAGWIGEAGPGPSYGDPLGDGTRAGVDNEFTNRNTTFMTWNLLHQARMLKAGAAFRPTGISGESGMPGHGSIFRTPNIDPDIKSKGCVPCPYGMCWPINQLNELNASFTVQPFFSG